MRNGPANDDRRPRLVADRVGAARRIGGAGLLALLRAVLAAAALATLDAEGVERAADDVVPDAGRSRTRPPRTSTIECSWRLCSSPGM
jgi:hypothetical protein